MLLDTNFQLEIPSKFHE